IFHLRIGPIDIGLDKAGNIGKLVLETTELCARLGFFKLPAAPRKDFPISADGDRPTIANETAGPVEVGPFCGGRCAWPVGSFYALEVLLRSGNSGAKGPCFRPLLNCQRDEFVR